jgi:hypothetical protein
MRRVVRSAIAEHVGGRIRVANSDWCASRIVVSVMQQRGFCSRIQSGEALAAEFLNDVARARASPPASRAGTAAGLRRERACLVSVCLVGRGSPGCR